MKALTTEKAVKLIETENTLLFEFDRGARKEDIKKEFESIFSVKVEKVRTLIKNNKKYAYIKLVKSSPAIDIATKLGMI